MTSIRIEVVGLDDDSHISVTKEFMIKPHVKRLCGVRLRLTHLESFELVEVALVTHDYHSFCAMLTAAAS